MKDRHKRTASAADLQGHCNLRQNSVSSASDCAVISIKLQRNLHQVITQSASNHDIFHYHIDSNRLKIIKEGN